MLISFFEEFHSAESRKKLRLISWPIKLYLAAHSLREFEQWKRKLKSKYVKEYVYWPILTTNEGYWISPFSKEEALVRIFGELEGKNIPVMIDAELPTTQNPWLYLTQVGNFFGNRALIRTFIHQRQNAYTAEYFPASGGDGKVMRFFGLHYDPHRYKNKVIKMLYHSIRRLDDDEIHHMVEDGMRKWGRKFILGYGIIAPGIGGNKPFLTATQLEKDLDIAANAGVREVVIFRLGGLTKKYMQAMRRFVGIVT